MVDIIKHIEYWKQSAAEDFVVAGELVERGRWRHGLFFMHLALEKILKAHVCKVTGAVPPKIHNLMRLAEIARLNLSTSLIDTLSEMTDFKSCGKVSWPCRHFIIQRADGVLNG
jgi:HEPN domain-containing protein